MLQAGTKVLVDSVALPHGQIARRANADDNFSETCLFSCRSVSGLLSTRDRLEIADYRAVRNLYLLQLAG